MNILCDVYARIVKQDFCFELNGLLFCLWKLGKFRNGDYDLWDGKILEKCLLILFIKMLILYFYRE